MNWAKVSAISVLASAIIMAGLLTLGFGTYLEGKFERLEDRFTTIGNRFTTIEERLFTLATDVRTSLTSKSNAIVAPMSPAPISPTNQELSNQITALEKETGEGIQHMGEQTE